MQVYGRVELAPGATCYLYIEDYEIKDCVISGEPDEAYANMPDVAKPDYSTQMQVREWYEKGYIEKMSSLVRMP